MRERDDVWYLIESVVLFVLAAACLLYAALADAQPASLNLNGQPLTAVLCDGGVVCSRRGSVATIIVTASSSSSGSSDFDGGVNVIEDEGVPLTKRTTVDFTGPGVTCSDTGSKTSCSIPGGSGSGTSPYVLSFGGF